MLISIHQPNYMPWLGYFAKMLYADKFVFHDDIQFSNNSYTNRVQIKNNDNVKWLTVPVKKPRFGTNINNIEFSQDDWPKKHLNHLNGSYAKSKAFKEVWPDVQEIYNSIDTSQLLLFSNIEIVKKVAKLLEIKCDFLLSSEIDSKGSGDDKLISIVSEISKSATYVSGSGGAKYQDPDKFFNSGLGFEYIKFSHPTYLQSGEKFQPGLSIIDAIFQLGWSEVSNIIRKSII